MLVPLLRSLRPRQWVKNGFVFAPAAFAEQLAEPTQLGRAGLAFALFCAASSAVYLLNDVGDREEDRRHPLKQARPVASGALSVGAATAVAAALAAAALAGGLALGRAFVSLALAYLGLQALYSAWLKQVVILDVMAIAAGFLLRVLAGAAAVRVEVSSWLLLCTGTLALFLAFSKRRHELALLPGRAAEQRGVLARYSPAFLDQMINVVTASTLVFYTLYAIAPETVEKFGTDDLVLTTPLVIFGIFRYLFLMYQGPNERNPTEAILADLPFLANLALWGIAVVWILYGRR